MTAREELYDMARSVITGELGILVNQSDIENTADSLSYAILAAGYRKPRTVTTVEELDALPVGSLLSDVDGDVCQRFRRGWRATIDEPNDDPWLTDTMEVDLPATVLHEPQP